MQRVLGSAGLLAVLVFSSIGCQKKETAGSHPSLFKDVLTKDLQVGTGPKAEEGDILLVTYEGKFPKDGKVFDTNDPIKSEKNKTPLAITVGQKIGIVSGLVQGIQGMQTGGKRTVSIPWVKGYGALGSENGIPPYSDLIFEVEALYLVKKGDSGSIEVQDTIPGTGTEIQEGDRVKVTYTCKLVNGRLIDDRSTPDRAVAFTVGRQEAISGFDRGTVGMRVGGKRKLILNQKQVGVRMARMLLVGTRF